MDAERNNAGMSGLLPFREGWSLRTDLGSPSDRGKPRKVVAWPAPANSLVKALAKMLIEVVTATPGIKIGRQSRWRLSQGR